MRMVILLDIVGTVGDALVFVHNIAASEVACMLESVNCCCCIRATLPMIEIKDDGLTWLCSNYSVRRMYYLQRVFFH